MHTPAPDYIPPLAPAAYLTERQAAALLNLSPETLRSWRSRRRGPPFVRLGGAVRYDSTALRRWAAGTDTTALETPSVPRQSTSRERSGTDVPKRAA